MFGNGGTIEAMNSGQGSYNDPLKSIDLSSWVSNKKLNDVSAFGMFAGCTGLNNLVFPKVTADKTHAFGDNTVDMSGIFIACIALRSFDMNKSFGANAEKLDFAFAFSTAVTELDFDKTDAKELMFGSKASSMVRFAAMCTNLRVLNMKNFSAANVKEATGAFMMSTSLVKFVIDDN